MRLNPVHNRCPLCRNGVTDIVKLHLQDGTVDDSAGVGNSSLETAEATPELNHAEEDNVPTSVPSSEFEESASSADLPREELSPAVPKGETSEGSETVPAAELPQRCVQRLMRELRTLARGETVADGIDLALFDPTGNDMRVWALKIHTRSIDPHCLLGKELRRLDILAVELELWIPDEFPIGPPRVRVLRPTFERGSFFVFDGALCLEILTTQGWSPAMSLVRLGVQIKDDISRGTGVVMRDSVSSVSRDVAWRTSKRLEAAHQDWRHFK